MIWKNKCVSETGEMLYNIEAILGQQDDIEQVGRYWNDMTEQLTDPGIISRKAFLGSGSTCNIVPFSSFGLLVTSGDDIVTPTKQNGIQMSSRKSLDEMAAEQGIDTSRGLHNYEWPGDPHDWDGFAEDIYEMRSQSIAKDPFDE